MQTVVVLTKVALKDLQKIPRYILIQFDLWVQIIETEGFQTMQKVKGYRDHSLKGNRLGQRSTSLSRSWRVIYILDEETNIITVKVLEVHHHDY